MITHLQNSVLTLLFLLSIGSINAQTTFIVDGLSYTVTEDTNVSVSKDATNLPTGPLTIPATVTNSGIEYTVNAIKDSGFDDCTGLTSVSVPETVTSIGEYAFSYCTSLESIDIPESVISIGEAAFMSCTSVTSIDIPQFVTSIGNAAFTSCTSVTSIDIPQSVTSIGDAAFNFSTSLETVTVAWTSSIPPINISVFGGSGGYDTINLIVPVGTVDTYNAAPVWSEFNITGTLYTNKNDLNTSFSVYPNPASSFIAVTGLKQETAYEVINVLGAKVLEGTLSMTTKIEIETLTKGIYFLKLDSGTLLKFLKK